MATPTLHDFVLNLLTDPAARTAFEIDPEGVLVDAGLGDITEADVQEVIPLVVDYAPISGLTGLVGAGEPALGDLDGDVTGAVRQLQGITQLADVGVGHNHGSDVTVNATAAAGVSASLDGPASLDLSLLDSDPAGTLDAVEPVIGSIEPVLHTADPVLNGADPVLHTADPILGGVEPLVGTTYGTAYGAADVTLGTVTDLDPGTVTSTVTHTVDSTLTDVTGLTDAAGSVTGPAHGSVSGSASAHGDGLLGDLLDGGDGHDGGLLGLH